MKTINPKSESNHSNKDRPWLENHYRKRKNRTVELVINSVDLLISKNRPVTLSNISQISKQIDPEGKGIHPNTIRVNSEAHAYYSDHSRTYKEAINRSKQKRKNRNGITSQNFENIKPDRDLAALQIRYKKMSKDELINRLIAAEQYIVDNNQKWVYKQFENYTIET